MHNYQKPDQEEIEKSADKKPPIDLKEDYSPVSNWLDSALTNLKALFLAYFIPEAHASESEKPVTEEEVLNVNKMEKSEDMTNIQQDSSSVLSHTHSAQHELTEIPSSATQMSSVESHAVKIDLDETISPIQKSVTLTKEQEYKTILDKQPITKLNEAQPNEVQPNEAQPNEAQPNEAQPNETQPNETQPNETQPNESQKPASAIENMPAVEKSVPDGVFNPILTLKARQPNKLEKLNINEDTTEHSVSADYSDNFFATQKYEAGDEGILSSHYQLGLKQEGTDSGLIDMATHQSILLYTVDNHIEGHVGNHVAFRVTVDQFGIVALTQHRAIDHNQLKKVSLDPSSGILLTRTDTATDADGNTVSKSASFNISKKLIFLDDSPQITQIQDPDQNGIIEIDAFNPSQATEHPLAILNWQYGSDQAANTPITLSKTRGDVSLETNSADQLELVFKDKNGNNVAKVTLHQDGTDTLELMHRTGNKIPNLKFVAQLVFSDQDGSSVKQIIKLNLDKDGSLSSSGLTLDGPISESTVFQDVNMNTNLDTNEIAAISDQAGNFNLMIHDANQDGIINHRDGRLVSLGGTDSETGVSYLLPLYAPMGSSVITPLTSLLQMQLEQTSDPAATKINLNQALGLDPNCDLMHANPLAFAESGDTTLLLSAAAIMTLATQLGAATAAILDTSDVMVAHAIYLSIGNEILNLGTNAMMDLADPSLMHQIIIDLSNQFGINPELYEPIIGLMIESQTNLVTSLDNLSSDSDPIEAITNMQHITEGHYVDSITHLYSPNAGKDFTFTTTHSELSENILDHVDMIPSEAHLTQLSFETNNAFDYVMKQGLPQSAVDTDGQTVHIEIPQDGSDVSFQTPAGALMTINNSGDFHYNTDNLNHDAVDNFSYTFQINATHQLKTSYIEINVIDNHKSFANVDGTNQNDILSSADHHADVVALKGHGGHNSYVVDISEMNPPEKILIMDLGISKQNVLNFTGVTDSNHDGELNLSDVVESFHQDHPNGDVTMTLQNQSTLVLHNVGTVQGTDVQALEQHLQHITQEVNIQ